MGQFHSDFDPINGHKECPWAIESFFIGKKLYIDKLTDSSGDIGFHVRGKGLTQRSIWAKANELYNGDIMRLYEALFNGDEVEFDLTAGQPSFEMRPDYTVHSRETFKRVINKRPT